MRLPELQHLNRWNTRANASLLSRPISEVCNAIRDYKPLHAEASGHPRVGSDESPLYRKLKKSDLEEGSDDEWRIEVTDDLDFPAAADVWHYCSCSSEGPKSCWQTPSHRLQSVSYCYESGHV